MIKIGKVLLGFRRVSSMQDVGPSLSNPDEVPSRN